MSLLEAIMLLCFGAAWPFSIYKSLHARSTQGKSALFMGVLIMGYVAGIANKIVYGVDPVLILYVINAVMVSVDLALWIRNRRYERQSTFLTKRSEAV